MKVLAVLSLFFITSLMAGEQNQTPSGAATLDSNPSEKDYVGPGEKHMPDGQKDHVFKVTLTNYKGKIVAVLIDNWDPKAMKWDTIPGNNNWNIVVVRNGEIQELPFELTGTHDELEMYVQDDGSIKKSKSQYEIKIQLENGVHIYVPVKKS